jgi:L-ascorbate metabolism protein UlaG (beta-lactamase superfamily)
LRRTSDHYDWTRDNAYSIPQAQHPHRSGLVESREPFAFAGPRRVAAPGVAFDRLPPIDCILLSHNHYDHLDLRTLARLHVVHAPLIVTPLGNDVIIRSHVPDARIVASDWHASVDLGDGMTTTIVPANHWSARGTKDVEWRSGRALF